VEEQPPEVVYVHGPEPEPVRQLELLDAEEPFVQLGVRWVARRWVERASEGDVGDIFERVWTEILPGVVYPGPADPGDHPSVHAMRTLIWRSIWEAEIHSRERQRAAESGSPADASDGRVAATDPNVAEPQAAAVPPVAAVPVAAAPPVAAQTRSTAAPRPAAVTLPAAVPLPATLVSLGAIEAKPAAPEQVEALTSEWPTPGRFVRVDDELAELGIECLAVRALGSVVVRAVQREGGTANQAQARVRRLMTNAPLCIAYAKLIEQSQWNAASVHELRAGQLVWCPPIQTKPLLDRRRPQVTLDQRPWSDGSPRLEPPPKIWT
jgi:hypothetical protein